MNNMKKVKNGVSYEMNGWLYVSIKGKPMERGYAYGKLVADEMKKVQRIQQYIIYNDYGIKWDFFNSFIFYIFLINICFCSHNK